MSRMTDSSNERRNRAVGVGVGVRRAMVMTATVLFGILISAILFPHCGEAIGEGIGGGIGEAIVEGFGEGIGEAIVEGFGEAIVDADGTVRNMELEGDSFSYNEFDSNESSNINSNKVTDPSEEFVIRFANDSVHRADIYWDDGSYGVLILTLELGGTQSVNTFLGHKFFVTRHGTKEGLFHGGGEGEGDTNTKVQFDIVTGTLRNNIFYIPEDAGPTSDLCQDRFNICESQAQNGGCQQSPGWMIVHCCKSCDPYINSSTLIDPKIRCSKEQLKTPDPVWKPGDLNTMFERWENDPKVRDKYGLRVLSRPNPGPLDKQEGTSQQLPWKPGPWVVVLDNFLTVAEVNALKRGGELEGFERSTDQGLANALGEQEKVVSTTRTSSNAWCMHRCESLPGVKRVSAKIEEITNISQKNYESFQILQYGKGQFYRRHHDSSMTDDSAAGPRILTFFLYLSDVEEGGETYFNKLDLAVKPKRGRALVWPSVLDERPTYWDARMFHEAKDVIKGEKVAANHWIHLNDYRTPNEWGCTGSFT